MSLAMLQRLLAALPPSVISFNAAMSACGAGGQWPEALQLLAEMRRHSVASGVGSFAALLTAVGQSWRWQEALHLLEEVRVEHLAPAKGKELLERVGRLKRGCRACEAMAPMLPSGHLPLLLELYRLGRALGIWPDAEPLAPPPLLGPPAAQDLHDFSLDAALAAVAHRLLTAGGLMSALPLRSWARRLRGDHGARLPQP